MKRTLFLRSIGFYHRFCFCRDRCKKRRSLPLEYGRVVSIIFQKRLSFLPWCSTIGFIGQNLPAGSVMLISVLP